MGRLAVWSPAQARIRPFSAATHPAGFQRGGHLPLFPQALEPSILDEIVSILDAATGRTVPRTSCG